MSVAAQILGNRFVALAQEGALGFSAMSRSPLVIDEGQYACAILDRDGRLIAQDQGEPSQLAAVQTTVDYTLDAFAFNLSEGDVILTGDPYCGGTWGGVLSVIVPVFYDGELEFISAIRFAAADLAGNVPGPFQPDANEIWQEALRLSPVKLVRAGAPQKDVYQYVIRNSRASGLLESDLTTAQVTASRIGSAIGSMIELKGLDLVRAAAEQRMSYGAERVRAAFASLGDGWAETGGISVRVTCKDGVKVDLAGSAGMRDDATNMTLQTTRAVILTQLVSDIIEDAGLSQGILDAIQVSAPGGSIVNADFPAAVSLGWRETAPLVSQALAQATNTLPALRTAPPLVMLFNKIGATAVTQPIALSPGFIASSGCSGGDAASGRRQLVSAELAETAGVIMMDYRQFDDSKITARVRILCEALEGMIVPGALRPTLTGAQQRERSNVLSLPAGTVIDFDYPEMKEECNASL